ncbi:energy transducer TonB [Luteimonas weifangensis]|uniref:Protein TonB n=2 Tax=Cognatiluteimonas weifangensis TaxID=2303539 RepID=A0A372DRB3_9GAMM|nr:energy transducer TonB [Luteimonas weifangensis]
MASPTRRIAASWSAIACMASSWAAAALDHAARTAASGLSRPLPAIVCFCQASKASICRATSAPAARTAAGSIRSLAERRTTSCECRCIASIVCCSCARPATPVRCRRASASSALARTSMIPASTAQVTRKDAPITIALWPKRRRAIRRVEGASRRSRSGEVERSMRASDGEEHPDRVTPAASARSGRTLVGDGMRALRHAFAHACSSFARTRRCRGCLQARSFPMRHLFAAAGLMLLAVSFATPASADLKPIKRVEPKYPVDAIRSGTQGFVELEFTVDADGKVISVSVVNARPSRTFEKAAVAAVKQWQFGPGGGRGKVRLDFKL